MISSFSQKPIFLIPGLMASPLSGSVTGAAHRYCPHNRTGLCWIDDLLVLPPLFNCVTDWIRLTWNHSTNDIEQLSYIQLNRATIGDVDSVTFVDNLLGFQIIPTYQLLASRFLNLGCVKGHDLFGIPYDGRFGLHQKPVFGRMSPN
jgi:hypothetical protein